MLAQGYRSLVAKLGGGVGDDAVVHEKDGFIMDFPGFQ